MTVIAWDGKSIAADKRGCIAECAFSTTKIWRYEPSGIIVATTGEASFGLAIVQWWKDGADPCRWPPFQSTDDWARLIVIEPGKRPYSYERQPVKQIVEDPFMAWGSGREFALGAMAMAATAREAVEIASRYDVYCGNGVDAFDLEPIV